MQSLQQFADQYNIPFNEILAFSCLGNLYAKWSEHELNGDYHPTKGRSDSPKCDNAKYWEEDTERLADKMQEIVQGWGFQHLDFGVGLYPTIQKTSSNKRGTLHFPYHNLNSIHIVGYKWFDKVNGNTYHSTAIQIDGEHIYKTEMQYGYGDQYLYTGFEYLYSNNFLFPLRYPPRTINYPDSTSDTIEGDKLTPSDYCRESGIVLYYNAVDVKRRKDL